MNCGVISKNVILIGERITFHFWRSCKHAVNLYGFHQRIDSNNLGYFSLETPNGNWRMFSVGGRKSVGTFSNGSILWGWEERNFSRIYGLVPRPVRKRQDARGSENCRTKIFTNAEFTKPNRHIAAISQNQRSMLWQPGAEVSETTQPLIWWNAIWKSFSIILT